MAKISILGVLSNVYIFFLSPFGRKRIGVDDQGNKYYAAKARKGYNNERRWVIYKKSFEASQVPPEWHGWLHHQTNDIPSANNPHRKVWQKPHQPNLTGTDAAYFPAGYNGGQRAASTGDYTAWQPPK